MLRAPALALSCLLVTLTPTLAAASERAPRVALAAFDDEVGLDPRALADMAVALRGAALEADVELVSLAARGDGAVDGRCDDACLDGLAGQIGATVLLTGHVTELADGRLQIALELRDVGEAEAFQRAATAADDTAALVRATDTMGRELLATLRPAEPAPPVVRRTPIRGPYRRDAYRDDAATQSFNDRSPGLALALEILFPGAGLGYAGDWGAVGLEYVGIFTGFLLVILSVNPEADGGGSIDSMSFGLGLALLVGARLYGIVRAPVAADQHNAEYRQRLLEQRGARLDQLRLRAPEIGLRAPAFTSFSLPPLSF